MNEVLLTVDEKFEIIRTNDGQIGLGDPDCADLILFSPDQARDIALGLTLCGKRCRHDLDPGHGAERVSIW